MIRRECQLHLIQNHELGRGERGSETYVCKKRKA